MPSGLLFVIGHTTKNIHTYTYYIRIYKQIRILSHTYTELFGFCYMQGGFPEIAYVVDSLL